MYRDVVNATEENASVLSLIGMQYLSARVPRMGSVQSFPLIPSLFLPFLLALFIFLLFIPFYSTRIVPFHFQAGCHRRRLNLALLFLCADFVLYVCFSYGCMIVFVVFDLVLSYGVIVVSPFCTH